MANILVCDDERSICEMLDISLRRENHRIETVQSGQAAKNKIDGALYDVIITDIKMPSIDGIEVLRHAHKVSPDSAVILITAVDDYEAAVEAVKAGGASDYIRKSPGLVDEIKLAINRALEKQVLSKQNFALRRDAATRNSLDNIIGSSAAMEKLKTTVRTVASTASTVLIQGESGTGKELVARAVHVCSPRAADTFVSVNCGAFPETLLESELFGHARGAFTGAVGARPGKFETANGGTLLLDEVGEMPLALQPKLLRALQEREFDRLGSNQTVRVDIRVIATSNRPLETAVAEGRFRADLFYRLNVIPMSLPPLRDRAGDIRELAEYFAGLYAAPRTQVLLSRDLVARLEEHAWPGNVRELGNFVRRAVALSRGGEIGVEALEHGQNQTGKILPRRQRSPEWKPEWKPGLSLGEMERQLFAMTLESTGGNRARAAELLGVSLRTVRNKVREFGLPPRNNYRNEVVNRDLQNPDLHGDDLRGNDLLDNHLRNSNSSDNDNDNANAKEQPCP